MLKRLKPLLLISTAVWGLVVLADSRAADVNSVVATCASCHGKDGASTESDVPALAGLSAEYLAGSLSKYRDNERPCPPTKVRAGGKTGTSTDMCQVAKDLSEADSKAIAQYFAGRKFVRVAQTVDPDLARKGKVIHEENCEKCHSDGGTVASDDAGILAGQRVGYLRQALQEFSSGKRPMDKKMKPQIQKLDQAGFEALVNFYGSFK